MIFSAKSEEVRNVFELNPEYSVKEVQQLLSQKLIDNRKKYT